MTGPTEQPWSVVVLAKPRKKLASTMIASSEPSPMPSHSINKGISARGGVTRKNSKGTLSRRSNRGMK